MQQDRWTDATAYEMYVGRWSRPVARRFLAWLDIPADARWLDLGCGTGALTSEILRHANPRSVLGVEPSDGFLALARDQVRDPRAAFRQASADGLPAEDGSIDAAVSGLVLNFIPDPAKALAELRRAVVPGGTVAAYVWDYAGHAQLIRCFLDAAVALDPAARAQDEGVRFPTCRPGPLRTLFEDAGLGDVRVEAIDVVTPFRDFDDYWTPFLTGVGPAPGYCAALDDASRDKLRARLKKSLPTDPDGAILLAARAWAVRGAS